MHLTGFQIFLWLAPTPFEVAIVVAMLYRKFWRDFPIFCSYLVFEIGRTCFLFLQRRDEITYFYGYWVTEALGSLAALWVIKELFDNVFERRIGLRRVGGVLFRWSVALLLVVAVLLAWTSPGSDTKRLMEGILTVKRALTFVESGLLGCLFFFVFFLGLPWQHHALGIGFGFGLYGAVEVAAITIRAMYGPLDTRVFNWIMAIVNNCCVLIWGAYILFPAPAKVTIVGEEFENLLEGWNDALVQLLRK